MSIDEQVHTAPPPSDTEHEPEGPSVWMVVRELVTVILQSARASVIVVGAAILLFVRASRSWLESHRPRHRARRRMSQRRAAQRATSSAGRRWTTPDVSTPGLSGTGVDSRSPDGDRRSAPTVAAAALATLATAVSRASDSAVSSWDQVRQTFTRPTRVRASSLDVAAAIALAPPRRQRVPALPLPPNPAAPRPKLVPEDARPMVVKLGTLLIASVAGAAAIVLLVGAIAPRAVADLAGSVDIGVVLPESASFAGLEQPSRVYAADGTLLAELRAEVDREVVAIDHVPEHVRDAVIAAEDRRFYEHNGYSVEGIGRAALANLRSGEVTEGGSTITQQLAKMNFLSDEQTLDRKISEIFYAMRLEEDFTKEELLERYLNEVYFGVSAYGVQAAAQEYYGVDVEDLRVDQAAVLAGVIPAPSALNPRANPERALEKRDQVLQDMFEIGAITRAERDAAQARELDVVPHVEQEVREPYIVAAVKRLFLDDPTFGATRAEREDKLFRGNLDITTTLDPALQGMAEETIEQRFGGSDGPTASIATVEPSTGAILAVASGQEFDSEQFDYALQGRQQPGSAFKTFVLANALREGFPPDLVLDGDSPIEITYDNGRRTYEPRNYGGASYGDIDMRSALRRSVNTYFVQLFELVGREDAVTLAGELGIDVPAAIGTTADYGPSLVLGGLKAGVTPVEMAGAYATFANNGVFHQPYLIERVVDGDGNELLDRGADDGREVFSPQLNAVIVEIMQGVTQPGGTAPIANVPNFPEAGKTGTTNDNTDAWFTGYTPVLSTAVWVGHPDADISMPGATGGGTAAPIWADFMRRAHEGREPQSFPDVDVDYTDLFIGDEVPVPDVVGDPEAEALQRLAAEKLIARVVRVNSNASRGIVVGTSPRAGSTLEQGERVTISVSTGVPPAPPPPPPRPEPEPEPEPAEPEQEEDSGDSGSDDGSERDPRPGNGGNGGGNGGNGGGNGNGNGDGNGGGD